jgi:GTP-binding protein HSR1-related protein
MRKNIFKEIERSIMNEQMEDQTREKLLINLLKMKNQKINLMVTGATGVGKSSTINALFGEEVAKVGTSVDPETIKIDKYELDNLVIWDTPGLGDGKEADNRHSKRIIDKLYEKDENGDLLIDLVLVILDGSSRDLGTSYELINNVIIPNLGENKKNRILVAINQADVAMKGKYWNIRENKPEEKLQKFLEDKIESVKRRIKEAAGIEVEPIYYSAGYKEEGYMQQKPYNFIIY